MASSAAAVSASALARARFKAKACSGLSFLDLLSWRLLIWAVGLTTPLLAALKERRFVAGEVGFLESAAGPSHLATQLLYLFFVGFAALALARGVGRKGKKVGQVRCFWLLTMLLAAMPTVSSLCSGQTLQISIVGIVATYAAVYFLRVPPFEWWCREARVMLLVVFVYGSLVAAVAAPHWAWNSDYAAEATTALLPMRLFGTTNHANALAPLAIFAWMLGRFPKCRLSGEPLHAAATLLVLLLTQSKTSWGIALLLAGVWLLKKIGKLGTAKKLLAYAALGAVPLAVAGYLFAFCHLGARLEDLLYDPQVITLTGRVPLWMVAIQTWLDAPLLGQGLEAWSSDALLDLVNLLGWAAPHAHNQILQVLSQSGVVGLAVFALWFSLFMRIVRSAPEHVRRPLWWLTAFFFLPGFTEVVLQYSLGPGNTVLAWLMTSAVVIVGSQQRKVRGRHEA